MWLFAYGAGFAVLASFAALRLLWPTPRLRPAATGRDLPAVVQRAVQPAVVFLRALGLLAFGVTFYAAGWGIDDSASNIAPRALCVVFWVAVPIVTALVGDVWAAMNPLDTLAWLLRIPEQTARRPPGQWTAAALLASFAWLELAYYQACNEPRVVAIWLTAYALAAMAGAVMWGRRWLRYGEGFAALFTLISHLAPLYRDQQTGRLRARAPGAGLAVVPTHPGTAALLFVALGSTTFDGFTRSSLWASIIGQRDRWSATLVSSVGLAMVILLVAIAYLAATRVTAKVVDRDPEDTARLFLASLIPVALAYSVAHYFSLLVFEGQNVIAQASDPFGRGWDLFGTAFNTIDFRVISPRAIAYVQVGAIVVGHVLGITAAHDKAVESYPKAPAVQSQYPLLAVMVLYTVGGLVLLLSA